MIATRWLEVKSTYFDAAALPETERAPYLESLAKRDPELAGLVGEIFAQNSTEGLDLSSPCWTAKTVAAPRSNSLAYGQCLAGRFEITHSLGAGGTGEVYRAFDRQQREFVAVKLLLPDLVADHDALRLLRNEMHTARLVSHLNVCRLHEFHPNEAENRPFLTMELVLGETLHARLKRCGRLQVEEAMPIVQQMLDGLEAAHRQGVLHRDFKPSNVMISDSGRVVLMDFGLARDVRPGQDIAQTISMNAFAGTVAYMSPEQLRGEPATAAADIHALGVVLFEMLTGGRPFDGGTLIETASLRLNSDAPQVRVGGAKIDRRWAGAISACLAKDPQARPQSVDAVRKILREGAPMRLDRRKALLAATAIAATGIVGALGWGAWQWTQSSRNRQAAFDHYVRGSKLVEEFSLSSARTAAQQFESALQIDPGFALAMAGLAEVHVQLAKSDSSNARSHLNEARSWANKAIETDPGTGEGHMVLASLHQSMWEWKEAEACYKEALRLKPRSAKAHRWYAGLALQFGRLDEGIGYARRALELDPDDRSAPGTLGLYYFIAGRPKEALALLEPAVRDLDSVSRSDGSRHNLAQVYAYLGTVTSGKEAAEYFAKALEQATVMRAIEVRGPAPTFSFASHALAHIHLLRGDESSAAPFVREVMKAYADGHAPAVHAALLHAARGQHTEAIAVLRKAVDSRDPSLLYINVVPFFSELRKDPRFQAVVRRMGY